MRMKTAITQNMLKKHLCRMWNRLLPRPILLRTVRKLWIGNRTYSLYLETWQIKYTIHTPDTT